MIIITGRSNENNDLFLISSVLISINGGRSCIYIKKLSSVDTIFKKNNKYIYKIK